jgi:diguanylate cyclase (GGDEF)-like protein/PAS domain S-box-containing protein
MTQAPAKHSDQQAMQRLLSRQVEKARDAAGEVDVDKLIGIVSTTYEEFNRDRRRADRSNQVMAEELTDTYRDLAKTAKTLQLQNERFEAAINNMSQGLCMFDGDGMLVVHNEQLYKLFGVSTEVDLEKKSLEDLIKIARQARGDKAFSDTLSKAYRNLILSRSSATLHMEYRDGQVLSVAHHPLSDGGFVHTFEDITDRHKAEAKVNHLATHDVLTDLPNRRLFKLRIEDALAKSLGRSAIFCLDLDGFKAINDTLGHAAGDELLTEVAQRLRDSVRNGDTVSRLGGDEFAILIQSLHDETAASILAERIVRELGKSFDLAGNTVNIGVSIGIAMAPRDGNSPERIIKSADMALYEAKRAGRGCFKFFEPRLDVLSHKRRALEMDLRRALDENQFELYFQPLVASEGRYITGFEALLRWNHPERGQVAPMDFIPLAEELGLIVPIGDWVIRTACATAAQWPDDVSIAVNVSARQFVNHDLVDVVSQALRTTGLDPARLEIEMTETALIDSGGQMTGSMRDLRKLGVRIAMDDFGTGYSSLAYLRRFRFSKVKIDRSFVSDLEGDPQSIAIVRAVVALCASLGIVTTAEGVETNAQANILIQENCTQLQGYFFGRPSPASAVPGMLQALGHRATCTA